ncbi:BMP family ABC transporter substrate-binding protein [Anaerococcus sp. AGMB09787]|uniref:BMP family lipoprotein n=1 Tax=Anaerococcus sp. AGMB09787 TaxID=2922869 RepID=UPI001FAF11F9|nr:BMP family ABC transporter substrate-binding protein [Anaerococcus sp. AGMB09787]
MKINKIMSIVSVLSLSVALAACGNNANTENAEDTSAENATVATSEEATSTENEGAASETPSEEVVKVTMVTDEGGVNDKSFNQSAYEGLNAYKDEGKVEFDYIESHSDADYQPNLESALDSGSDLILTVGYALYNDTSEAADTNPDQKYAIIDNANIEEQENLLGITFADHQNSFLAGYIAGMKSESNHVGFVGGQVSDVIDRFEYGFRAGIAEAAKEKGKEIKVDVQYANSYADQAAGKNIANQMYQSGADVVMHAAGGTGIGVIEAAKENDKWVIGVDRDQGEEAPDNMLVSTIKGVGDAIKIVVDDLASGKFEGGTTRDFTLADGKAVDLAYGPNDLVSQEIKDKVEELREKIVAGEIEVPQNEEEFTKLGYEK